MLRNAGACFAGACVATRPRCRMVEFTVAAASALLGVDFETSTPESVHAAWKAGALKHHPDRNPDDVDGATQRFKELGNAHSAINSASRRPRRVHCGACADAVARASRRIQLTRRVGESAR